MNDATRPDERETMSDDDRRLAALLASVQAEANPAVWARVRTRLAAKDEPATARTPTPCSMSKLPLFTMPSSSENDSLRVYWKYRSA